MNSINFFAIVVFADPHLVLGQSILHLRDVCWTRPGINVVLAPPTSPDFVDRCDKREYLSCQQDQITSRYMCVCHHGPDPTDRSRCKRPDPTQTFGQPCDPLFDCIQPFICRPSSLSISQCRCPEYQPIYNPALAQCGRRPYGALCDFFPNECQVGLDCMGVPARCGCPPNRRNWLQGRCIGNLEGTSCIDYHDCAATLGCFNGTCRCPGPFNPKKINWNDQKKECEANGFGAKCAAYDDCLSFLTCDVTLTCACPHGHQYNASIPGCVDRPQYGDHCDSVAGIENNCEYNLVCVVDICRCKTGQTLHRDRAYCIFPVQRSIGSPCTASVQCRNGEGLSCRSLHCACQQPAWIWSAGHCRDRRGIVTCNPQDILGECQEVTPWLNWECDPADRHCECPGNTEWAAWAQACKLKPGETCELAVIGGTMKPTHDLCAGQHCIGPGEESLGRLGSCACAAVNSLPHIYSLEPGHGCVPNYFGQKCDPQLNHVDCRPDTNQYNGSRTGLVCDWATRLCHCASRALEYINGYCIEANLLPGSDVKCDRRFGPTCKIDPGTGLTCEDSGNGTTSGCVCLPKVVNSSAGNGTGARMSWNAQLRRCDLGALYTRCTHGYECQSHICTNGFCSPAPCDEGDDVCAGIEYQAVTFLTFGSILVHHIFYNL